MKKFIKILVIAIVALLLLGILLPFIFKGKIIELAKREINKSVNAKVEFSGISLGFFRSFPDFSLGVKDLSITGAGLFEGDTLAYIKNVRVTIDLRSVFSSGGYEIKRIGLYKPVLHIKTLADGASNYDIALPSSDTLAPSSPPPADTTPGFELHLKKLEIKEGRLSYHDHSMNLFFAAGNLEHTLRGNLSEKSTLLETETTISGLDLTYEGIPYLKQAKLHYVAGIDADLVNSMYTMRDNEMTLNHLFIRFAGSVGLSEDDININLTFSSPKNEFKHLLSLIPALYLKDFEGIETDGIIDLHGKVDGVYNEENLPSFDVQLAVQNGSFGYPDLPGKVTDISIKASIFNPGGDADNTIIDVSEFSMMMNNAPVQMKMNLKTPVSDPDIHLVMKAFFDLATLKDIYPMDETDDLSGKIDADFTLAARVSQFENEKYEEINAEGFVTVTDLIYYTDYIGQQVAIKEIALRLSPALLQLANLDMNIGNSDLKATGSLSNYLAYGFSDGTLKGNLVVHSDFFDLSALLPDETAEEGAVAGETAETSSGYVVQIPENIDFSMSSSFRKLLYDGIEMENVKGYLIANEGTIRIKDFTMDILDGKMGMQGSYSAVDPVKPAVDFSLDLKDVDLQKTYNTFALVSKYLPLAEKTNGKVNIRVAFNTLLDNEMMPVYESLSGEGRFTSSMIKISNVNTLNKIGDFIKFEKIKSMDINKIMFDFKFIDGKVIVEPFDFAFETIKGVLGGSTALDESIDYVMTLNIPRKEFGSAANNVISGLAGELGKLGVQYTPSETVGLNVLIGGLLSDPEVKVSLKETGKSLVDDLQTKIKEEITQKVQEVSKELKEKAQKIIDEADKRANALIAEAEKQAASVRQNAQTAAARVLEESEKQAVTVEEEGKKKGLLAAAAAKESAKKIREGGKSNSGKIIQEGDNQADAIVAKARSEAETIRKNARNDAEKIFNP